MSLWASEASKAYGSHQDEIVWLDNAEEHKLYGELRNCNLKAVVEGEKLNKD